MPQDPQNLFEAISKLQASGIDPVERHDEIWARYGRRVAVLILDSCGFSRVTQSHGILHFLSSLMQVRELSQTIFEAHNSLSVHFIADNIFVMFAEVDDAIAASQQVHQAIHDSGIMLTEDEKFRISIGIGYGEMLYSETVEGLLSEEMNYASKLGEDVAVVGETLLTSSAHEHASKPLVAGFSPRNVAISGLHLDYHRALFCPES